MKTKPRILPLLFSGVAVCALVLGIACGDDDDDNSTQQGAESAVCGDLNQVNSSIDDVKDLDSSSSIDDITGNLAALGTSLTDLQSSLREARYDKTDEIQAAGSDLRDALSSAVRSGSLSDAQADLNQAADDLKQNVEDAKDNNGCN